MYQIRSRPKDQSSDEEEDVKEQSHPQSTFNDVDVDLKESDDETNNVSTVHFDENDDDQKCIDFSMFESKENKCGGNNNEKGITEHCGALQRLGAALRAYSALNSIYNGDDDEMEPDHPTFIEFIGSEYRVQFLEDFNHFMAEHQYFGEEIKEEIIKRYGLKRCIAKDCALTTRHFGRQRSERKSGRKQHDVRSRFYRQKFDSLHFHIFHLEESGYRYRSKSQQNATEDADYFLEDKLQDDDNERKAIDPELKEAVSAISASKKECDFGRFQGDGPNKYNLSVSGTVYPQSVMFGYLCHFLLMTFSQDVDGQHD